MPGTVTDADIEHSTACALPELRSVSEATHELTTRDVRLALGRARHRLGAPDGLKTYSKPATLNRVLEHFIERWC